MILEDSQNIRATSQTKNEKKKEVRPPQLKIKEMQEREYRQRQKRERDIQIERSNDRSR